ncbi:hypothetical protein RJ639_014797 [Escallonia herrerae]|uniref:PPM-type phosphatase domain-containing protein n=1 Tax=Escallonia herrerae TaxID=1293975 RepID=A0AA89AMC1_9ASTE|nr:hypothetical protein RJ639_014797 [Escallonia herrerae]
MVCYTCLRKHTVSDVLHWGSPLQSKIPEIEGKSICSTSKKLNSSSGITFGPEVLYGSLLEEKACFSISTPLTPDSGKGKNRVSRHITHGFHLVEGKSNHAMEDCLVSKFEELDNNELGLFAIYDGHMGHDVAKYLQSYLFDNILKEHDFWINTESAIKRAYHSTDKDILEQSFHLGKGGSTAVTAILINGEKLVVANVGDSRAVICKKGLAKQLSVDHEPSKEKKLIESKGGFVSNLPGKYSSRYSHLGCKLSLLMSFFHLTRWFVILTGDVPRVDGQLAVARAFGDKSLKRHLSSEPDVLVEVIDDDAEFIILASDGLWKVMSNQEAADSIKNIKDAQAAAKHLAQAAQSRKSRDDISCIVVRF